VPIEMYVQGVSTRKIDAVAKELRGHDFSASAVSRMKKRLDAGLERFAQRRLEVVYPYLVLDARYEKVRVDGVIRDCAVLVAVGINWESRREILGVEQASRESHTSWNDLLLGLNRRGLFGARLIRALRVETHEDWIESHRYLNMTHLRDHLKAALNSDAA